MQQPAKQSNGVYSRYNVLSMYLPALVMSMGTGVALPVLPVLAKSFDVSFGTASLVLIVYAIGSLASAIPTGFLVDRIGRRPVLIAGPLLTGLAAFLTAFAGTFPELLVYRFISGWASQMWMQSRLAVIADTASTAERGRQLTTITGLSTAGRMFSPLVGGLMGSISLQAPFVLEGMLALVAAIPTFMMIKETRPSHAERAAHATGGSALRELLIFGIIMLWISQALASITRGAIFNGAVNLYATYTFDLDTAALGVLASAAGVVGIPITLSAGHIMDRFGRKATLVPGFLTMAVWLLIMAVTAEIDSPYGIFVATYLGLSASLSLTSGNMMTLGTDMAPVNARGMFFGIWRFIGDIGAVLSPTLFALFQNVSNSASFVFLASTALATALIIGTQVKETLRRPPRVETPAPQPAEAPAPESSSAG